MRLADLRSVPKESLLPLHSKQDSYICVSVARAMLYQGIEKLQLLPGSPDAVLDRISILRNAIVLDNSNALAYSTLAELMLPGDTVQLPSLKAKGSMREWTRDEVAKTALALGPTLPAAYWQVAGTIRRGSTMQVPNSSSMNREQLCMKAVHLDPECTLALSALAREIAYGWAIQLATGDPATKESLYLRAIEVDRGNWVPYLELAQVLYAQNQLAVDDVYVPGSPQTSRLDLLLDAVHLEPSQAKIWAQLARELDSDDARLTLRNGESLAKREILLKSIELDHCEEDALYQLASSLGEDEKVLVLGEEMDKSQLMERAITCSPNKALRHYYTALKMIAEGTPDLQVQRGDLTAQQHLLISIAQDSSDYRFYRALADLTPKTATSVKLLNGLELHRDQLMDLNISRDIVLPPVRPWGRISALVGMAMIGLALLIEKLPG